MLSFHSQILPTHALFMNPMQMNYNKNRQLQGSITTVTINAGICNIDFHDTELAFMLFEYDVII